MRNADGYQLSFLAAGAAPGTTIVTQVVGRQCNGNAYDGYQLSILAAGPAPGTMLREGRVSAMGNGECSPGSQPTQQGTLAATSIY